MSEKKWVVDLSAEERGELLGLIGKGKAAARRLTRAYPAAGRRGAHRRGDRGRAAHQPVDRRAGPPVLRRSRLAGVGRVGSWRGCAAVDERIPTIPRRRVDRQNPTLRFQPPPIEPCMQFSRTRLSDVLHRRAFVIAPE